MFTVFGVKIIHVLKGFSPARFSSFIVASTVALAGASVFLLGSCTATQRWKEPLALAEKYKTAGDNKNAIKNYRLAIEEMEKAHADKSTEVEALEKLIALEKREHNYEEIQKLCQKAIPMADLAYGPNSLKLIPLLAEARDASSKHADREKSAALLERIISIQEKNSGSNSVQLMWYLEDYAKSTSPTCGDKFDVQKLRHLVALREKHFGPTNTDTIKDKLILADVLGQNSTTLKEADPIYLDCIKSARTQGQPNLVSNCLLRYARFMRRSKRQTEALPYLQEAYAISGPGKHYNTLMGPDIADMLGEALEAKGKTKEARQVYSAMIAQLSNQSLGTHPMLSEFSERYASLK